MLKIKKEKKKVNVKAIVGVILLIISGFILFAINAFYMSQQKVDSVVVFVNDVSIGSKITAEDITTKEVGIYGISKDFIKAKDKSEVIGKFAKVDLKAKDIAFRSKIGKESLSKEEIAQKGMCIVTVDVSISESVGTHLQKGDKVGVVSVRQNEEDMSKQVNLSLDNVTVFAIDNSQGKDITSKDAKQGQASETIPTHISLILSKENCVKLIDEKANGTIHLIYEGVGK